MKNRFALTLISIGLLAGCTVTTDNQETFDSQSEPGTKALDYDGFLAALLAAGADATPAGSFTSLALTGDERLLRVNGQDLQVYEYGDAATAEREAAYISPDGGTINVPDPSNPDIREVSIVEWIATPHFYRSGRLIVQYVGDDQAIIDLLTSILGPQFADGTVPTSSLPSSATATSSPSSISSAAHAPSPSPLPLARLPLVVWELEWGEGVPTSFEEAARQAPFVFLAEVLEVEEGPLYLGEGTLTQCWPSQLVTLKILVVYKGPLELNQIQTLYQLAGVGDRNNGCGNISESEKAIVITMEDPLYQVNQRYLLAVSPYSDFLDKRPAIRAANPEVSALVDAKQPIWPLPNGRLYVEQGGHASLDRANVPLMAYDDFGRAIPGASTGRTLADYEALLRTLPQITVDAVQVEGGEIRFAGSSTLPNGTCLQTRLVANGADVSWWPAACAVVQNGGWEISVMLGTDGVPNALDESAAYALTAWQQDNLAVISETFSFNLGGPPPAD